MARRKDLHKLLPLSYFENFNMETKVDRIVDDFRKISYCQASPIRVLRDGELVWFMVKDPMRSMSRLCYCDSKFLKSLPRFRLSVGLCELAVSSGVPIMQNISLFMISEALGARPLGSIDKYPARVSGNVSEVKNIPMETRCDFEEAFGISVERQLDTETQLAGKLRSTQGLTDIINKYKFFITN
jgi:hypothetical protein